MIEYIPENQKDLLEIEELSMDLFFDNLKESLDKSQNKENLTIEKVNNNKIKIINKNGVTSDLVINFSEGTCRLAYGSKDDVSNDAFSLYIKNKKINPENKKDFDYHTGILEYVARLQKTIYREYEEKNFTKGKYIEVPGYKDDDETFYIINLAVTLETKKEQEKLSQDTQENLDTK